MAIEMDRFVAGGDWRFHDVLSSTVPKTDRGRTHHAFGRDTRKADTRSSCCFHISAVAGTGDPALSCALSSNRLSRKSRVRFRGKAHSPRFSHRASRFAPKELSHLS